jgi:hypothetical protein
MLRTKWNFVIHVTRTYRLMKIHIPFKRHEPSSIAINVCAQISDSLLLVLMNYGFDCQGHPIYSFSVKKLPQILKDNIADSVGTA